MMRIFPTGNTCFPMKLLLVCLALTMHSAGMAQTGAQLPLLMGTGSSGCELFRAATDAVFALSFCPQCC